MLPVFTQISYFSLLNAVFNSLKRPTIILSHKDFYMLI